MYLQTSILSSFQFYTTKDANGYRNNTIIDTLRLLVNDINFIFKLNKLGITVTKACWAPTNLVSQTTEKKMFQEFEIYAACNISIVAWEP